MLDGLNAGGSIESGEDERSNSASATWIGRYRLVRKLGEGGFGVVWQAEQDEPVRREVALKVLKPGIASEEILARFASERQALTVMEHPGIAALLDAGQTEDGQPFFVMPLVRGRPITKYCDDRQLGLRRRLELFLEVCDGVDHAHRRGILHRDLKPSNIMVEEVDARAVVRIIDFGIAKMIGSNGVSDPGLTLTGRGLVIGTPQYMSPEQASSHPDIDTRSDVYALGAVLYELLTGAPPLETRVLKESSWDQILKLVQEAEVVRPSSKLVPTSEALDSVAAKRHTTVRRLAEQVRGELDWIVLRALEKDRNRRYSGASALADDIRRHLNGEPVAASPPSGVYRMKKYLRRHWLPVSAAGAIALALLAGGGASFWQWRLARHAAQESQDALHALVSAELKEAKQRGDAGRVLGLVEKARQSEYPLSDDLLFYEIEALDALGDPRFPDLLVSLDREKLSPEMRPRLDYWRGDRLIHDGETKAGSALLRTALAQGLPPLESSLARGLLSDTATEALNHYRDAVDIAPHRPLAQRNFILALMLSGKIDEARTQIQVSQRLLPQDRDFYLLEALLESFQQHPEAGLAALDRLPDPNDPAKALFLPLIEPISRFCSDMILAFCGVSPALDIWQQLRLNTAIAEFQAAAGKNGSPPGLVGVAPVLTRGIQGMVNALWNYHTGIRGESSVQILRDTLRSNDEGLLWALLGSIELVRREYTEAADAFRRAQTTPALVRHVREAARLMEGASEAGRFGLTNDPECHQRAVEALADAFESDLPQEAFKSILASDLPQRMSLKHPDRMFARRMAARMPKESVAQLTFLAKIEYAEGNRPKALELAERAQTLHPDDASLPTLAASIRDGTLELPKPSSMRTDQDDKE